MADSDNTRIILWYMLNWNIIFNKRQWINGTIYAPQRGLELNLKINYAKENELEAEASKLFFWKSITWERL